jgi:hypothetical protein
MPPRKVALLNRPVPLSKVAPRSRTLCHRKTAARCSKTWQLSKKELLNKTSSRSTTLRPSKTPQPSRATQLNEAAPSSRWRLATRQHVPITLLDIVAAVHARYSADDVSGAGIGNAIGVLVPNRRASSTFVNPIAL